MASTCDGGSKCTLGAPLTAVKAERGGHDEKMLNAWRDFRRVVTRSSRDVWLEL